MDIIKECSGHEAMTVMLLERVDKIESFINDIPLDSKIKTRELRNLINEVRLDLNDVNVSIAGLKTRVLSLESDVHYLLIIDSRFKPPLSYRTLCWSLSMFITLFTLSTVHRTVCTIANHD